MRRTILSLCDYSGNWPRPFLQAGMDVVSVDPKHIVGLRHTVDPSGATWYRLGMTAGQFLQSDFVDELDVWGLLMAPPCTDFTVSGARWWPEKDADGRTQASAQIVRDCLSILARVQPAWWALENPVGRLPRLVPELGKPLFYFQPCDYAGWAEDPQQDRYTKKTGIWGQCAVPLEKPLDPIMYETANGKRGSWMWAKLGGKSDRTKELRSNTPMGFARAFAAAQILTFLDRKAA